MLMFSDWFKNDFFDIVQLVCGAWLCLFGLVLVRLTTVLHDDSISFRFDQFRPNSKIFIDRAVFSKFVSELEIWKNKNISQYSTERKTHTKPNEKWFFTQSCCFAWLKYDTGQSETSPCVGARNDSNNDSCENIPFFINSENKVGDKPFLWQWK